MEWTLRREPTAEHGTFGALYIGAGFECYTLEDPVRADPVPETAANEAKIPGRTAIPPGRYEIVLTWSPKFQRVMPELKGVPGYTGVRIHPGNSHRDTAGCILPGKSRLEARLGYSQEAFNALFAKLSDTLAAGERVWISIE
jgi:hypothetical protein